MGQHREMLSLAVKYMDDLHEQEARKISQLDALLLKAATIQIPEMIGKK